MICSNKKRIMSVVLLMTMFLSILSMSTSVNASGGLDSDIIINGKKLNLDVKPVAVNGRIYVPIRAILEHLGMTVTWDQASQTVIGKNISSTLKISLKENGGGESTYNGVPFNNQHESNIALNGRTLVPVRTVGSLLGLNVKWDDSTKNVILTDSYRRDIGLKKAYEIVKTNTIFVYDDNLKYVHVPFGGYASHDNYILDNYYIFSMNTWDGNLCIDKQTGDVKVYVPKIQY